MNAAVQLHEAAQSPWLDNHGRGGPMLPEDGGDAGEVVARVEAFGIDVPALASTLQQEGAAAFSESWDDLLRSIESKRAALAGSTR